MEIKKLKEEIINRLRTAIRESLGEKSENPELIFPPDSKFGDFTLECFSLAKKFKKSPSEIASLISSKINPDEIIEKADFSGPYVNLKITNTALFSVIKKAEKQKEKIENSKIGRSKKVMVEYLGPNTNKPLHLGHLRNAALGISLSKILEKDGNKIIKANIINDRGVHICKSMLAYRKWGKNSTPELLKMKSDHFVGYWYVKYNQELKNNPELEKEIQEMLEKWEKGDPEILKLWKKMNDWVYEGWKETFQKFGIGFDAIDYESETYKLGKDIVEKGLKNKIFEKENDNSIVFNLPEEEFGLDKDKKTKKITLLRPDGTSVYITQDLGTATQRFKKYKLDKLIYIVGEEQNYHFKCLFKILEALGYDWAKNLHHLSHGIVNLPEGKMKSREGKVVDADDLISEMINLAKEEIKKRDAKLSSKELNERAEKIGIGAIKFYFTRIGAKENMEFNPKESISFDGFTGPYCQYAYARIASILRKSIRKETEVDFSVLGNNSEERELIKKIIEFPDVIKKSAQGYNPSAIAQFVYETAKLFNQFYQKHPILKAENEKLKNSRIALVRATQAMIKNGLDLLGIDVLEQM